MAEPRRCPICDGTGKVPVGFYGEQGTDASMPYCKSCQGTGIVWDYSVCAPYNPPTYYGGTVIFPTDPYIRQYNIC